nr:pre-mRNA 3' end processing protein WDR33-like [Dermatophagoides farinae]
MSNTYRNPNPVNITNTKTTSFVKPQTSFYTFQPRPPVPSPFQNAEFDGKRLRKAVARKTVDYNSSIVKMLESRIWQRDPRDYRAIQPDVAYYTEIVPPMYMQNNAANCITTKFVRTSTNKMRCPIFCVLWTPEGRRLITGSSSGEFTLWNGLTFNFETILQAHDTTVKVMVWSRNDSWMVTGDQNGYVKYWQSNMNNVKMFQAHKEPVRAISFCPTDTKFATCSDDGTIRIWDFFRCFEERILRGHGADVKGVDWHPTKALIASGSKDSQQPVKLWDPKSGQSLATLHAHKNTVTDVKWNHNGNWLLTSSRDHLIKIYDIRNMTNEMQTFRGHKKEVSCLAWHPIHEGLFASGGSDGSILFWLVGTDKEIGCMENAHESIVWSLSWHPLGHILTSGSNDHTCKFWTRNRPGDKMRDRYNLNLLPKGVEECEDGDDLSSYIPGMGFNDIGGCKNDEEEIGPIIPGFGFERSDELEMATTATATATIPSNESALSSSHQQPTTSGTGNDNITSNNQQKSNKSHHHNHQRTKERKQPYSKPIPKKFQQQWNNMENMKNNNSNLHRNNHHHPNQQQQHQHQQQLQNNSNENNMAPMTNTYNHFNNNHHHQQHHDQYGQQQQQTQFDGYNNNNNNNLYPPGNHPDTMYQQQQQSNKQYGQQQPPPPSYFNGHDQQQQQPFSTNPEVYGHHHHQQQQQQQPYYNNSQQQQNCYQNFQQQQQTQPMPPPQQQTYHNHQTGFSS